jgi:uncharacterized iron-regulated protein
MNALRLGGCLLALVILVAGCRSTGSALRWHSEMLRDHPLVGRIWDVRDGRFVPEDAVTTDIVGAPYVLLGEKHDNPDHHVLQTRMLEALVAAGRRPAAAFEMLTPAQAPALARHLAAHPRDAAGVAKAVEWEKSGWDWAMYEPIVRVAVEAGLPIVAANLDSAQVRAVSRGGVGALDPAFVARHGLGVPLPADQERQIVEEIRDSHCGHAPERMLAGMVAAQRARDARLAEAMVDAPGRDGAVLITGAGHVRRDRGVPAYLARVAPGVRVASVAFLEVEAGREDAADYGARFDGALPFDYVWFTPAVDSEDVCEKFRKPLERLRR